MGPGGDDRFKGRPLEAHPIERGLNRAGRRAFGLAARDDRAEHGGHGRQQPAATSQRLEFDRILDEPPPLDDLLGRLPVHVRHRGSPATERGDRDASGLKTHATGAERAEQIAEGLGRSCPRPPRP